MRAVAVAVLFILACADAEKAEPESSTTVKIPAKVMPETPLQEAEVEEVEVVEEEEVLEAPPITLSPETCEWNVQSGEPIEPGLVEDAPNYDTDLTKVDLSQLSASINMTVLSNIQRAVVDYMLERERQDALDVQDAIAQGPLGYAVVAAFAKKHPSGTKGVDFTFLRQGLARFYHCTRNYPVALADFVATYGDYKTWTTHTVNPSQPKRGERRMYANEALHVFVAETVLGDGSIRETEILLATNHRADKAYDFLVYDHDGKQARTSHFGAPNGGVVSASPYTCMACHVDTTRWVYDVRVP